MIWVETQKKWKALLLSTLFIRQADSDSLLMFVWGKKKISFWAMASCMKSLRRKLFGTKIVFHYKYEEQTLYNRLAFILEKLLWPLNILCIIKITAKTILFVITQLKSLFNCRKRKVSFLSCRNSLRKLNPSIVFVIENKIFDFPVHILSLLVFKTFFLMKHKI